MNPLLTINSATPISTILRRWRFPLYPVSWQSLTSSRFNLPNRYLFCHRDWPRNYSRKSHHPSAPIPPTPRWKSDSQSQVTQPRNIFKDIHIRTVQYAKVKPWKGHENRNTGAPVSTSMTPEQLSQSRGSGETGSELVTAAKKPCTLSW